MRLLLFLFLCSLTISSIAQEPWQLPIDTSLTRNAHSVYRLHEERIEIHSPSHYTRTLRQVITILNAEGLYHLTQAQGVDKFHTVAAADITVYDKKGLPFKRYSKKDFETRAAFDGISLITDDKVMQLKMVSPDFPSTLDIQYRFEVKGYLELPDLVINNNRQSFEKLIFSVNTPATQDIRFLPRNINLSPIRNNDGTRISYNWSAGPVAAEIYQKGSYSLREQLPQVRIAPTVFEYDRYAGSFANWSEFGKWSYPFYEESNLLPSKRMAELKNLTSGLGSPREKAVRLYSYLQEQMRYVSIQMGIGGFKPFSVKMVDEKKYGDCKALTHYMRFLLQSEGIRSYPALINAGWDEAPIDPGFPANAFNHVILCVPNGGDTLWLECTSKDSPPQFLGNFTDDRPALLLTENGGVVVRTPAMKKEDNQLVSSSVVTLNGEGGGTAALKFRTTGEQATILRYLGAQPEGERKELLERIFLFKASDGFRLEVQNGREESKAEGSSSWEQLYEFKAGNRCFFPLRLLGAPLPLMPEVESKTSFVLEYPYVFQDTVKYVLPPNFALDEMPPTVELSTPLAHYKRTTTYDASSRSIQCIIELTLEKRRIETSEYATLQAFFKKVRAWEEEKLVLKMQ